MQAALLYLAAGKRTTLTNLAKAAKDEKKALAKLLQFDMGTERGRHVAEKNAFHLLRNRDYLSTYPPTHPPSRPPMYILTVAHPPTHPLNQKTGAAAVFLLPSPPQLSLALDVLVRHIRDPMLALLVARLVRPSLPPTHPTHLPPLSFTSTFSIQQVEGGGGGGGREENEQIGVGPLTKELLEKDLVPWAREESEGGGLEAACWLWVGKGEEAIQALERGAEEHRGEMSLPFSLVQEGGGDRGGDRGGFTLLPYEAALFTYNTCLSKLVGTLLPTHLNPSLSLSWRTRALRIAELVRLLPPTHPPTHPPTYLYT